MTAFRRPATYHYRDDLLVELFSQLFFIPCGLEKKLSQIYGKLENLELKFDLFHLSKDATKSNGAIAFLNQKTLTVSYAYYLDGKNSSKH